MSLKGQINKVNADFFNAVRNASMKGSVDSEGGVYGTRKMTGYVCKVHPLDDGNEKLQGTVDVQEFGYEPGEDKYEGAGYHEGVMVSAIQPNRNGVFLMPSMYSDVVFAQDPVSMEEYILMCSHVDVVQMQSHSRVKIGVVETEAFKESEDDDNDSPDIDDLEETGNSSCTQYNSEGIVHTVKNKDGEITVSQTASEIIVTAKDSTVTITADGKVRVSAKDLEITGESTFKTSSPKTILDGDSVEITGNSFVRKGKSNLDGNGGFCGIPVCPFTGAIHAGSTITEG